LLTHSGNSQHFMETQDSLSYSQQSTTCLFPGPDESSPRPRRYFSKTNFDSILPSTSGSSWCTLSFSFFTDKLYPLLISHISSTCSAHLKILDLIILIIFNDDDRLVKVLIVYFSPTS
jgi:hypothetical protein